MTRHSDNFNQSARGDLLREYGEAVTYKPAAGGSRAITARVQREPDEDVSGLDGVREDYLLITVANDSTTGIASSEVNTGGDAVSVAERIGDAAEDRDIARIVSHTDVFVVLALR